ncbi:MAG: hypothetical protein KA801_07370 [Syntrophorhabdaceae bacterium]|nr:hypothetical protein [Syntrophorhabdaceae bacterium]
MRNLIIAILIIFIPVAVFGATAQCPRYSVSMEGTTSMFGISYTEIMEAQKIGGGSGYNGRWKVTLLEQIITYPGNIPVEAATDDIHDLGMGIKIHSTCAVMGNIIRCHSTSDTMFIQVSGNSVRMEGAPVSQGTLTGSTMTWKFDHTNPNEPVLSGVIAEGPREPIELTVIEPKEKARYEFSTAGNVLVLDLEVKTKPERYADSVEWTVPELEGVTRRVREGTLTGRRLEVIYENLPKENTQFGKKKVTATLKAGACTATETKEVRFFYPRDAKNNPGGEHYNWFYYWKQTPAAHPFGQTVGIEFGGTQFDACKDFHVPAMFKPAYMYKTIHVCDLTAKLNKKFLITFPAVKRSVPATLTTKSWKTATHIDTFAVLMRHEFIHFNAYHTWREGKTEAQMDLEDTDTDGVIDSLEPGMGFVVGKYQTYWGDDPEFKNINGDEEFLAYESMYDYVDGTYDEYDWGHPGKNWPEP